MANKFKGTRGKWYVDGEKYFTIQSRSTDDRRLETLPTIATVNTTFINQEEAKANAILIGSSKELLESLIIATNLLKDTTEFDVLVRFRMKVKGFEDLLDKITKK